MSLAPALGRAGAGVLDEILAARPSRDYTIVAATTADGRVTFDLAARPGVAAAAPRLRWVVARASGRPLRADLLGADGRVRRVVEFAAWSDGAPPGPRRLVIRDVVRGGAPLAVEIVAVEAREAPEALFDLSDGAARRDLPAPPSP